MTLMLVGRHRPGFMLIPQRMLAASQSRLVIFTYALKRLIIDTRTGS